MKLNFGVAIARLALTSCLLGGCIGYSRRDVEKMFADAKIKAEEESKKNAALAPAGSGVGVCSGGYKFRTGDAQLDGYCGTAFNYRCNQGKSASDPGVRAVCQYYDDLKDASVAPCPYCN